AAEWGPPQFFRPVEGKLVPWPVPVEEDGRRLGPAELSGWWNGVVAGDFDGDGRLDVAASNWGLNHWDPGFSLAARGSVRRIRFGDLGSGSGFDLLETFVDGENGQEYPARSAVALRGPFPAVVEKAPNRSAYGRATVADLWGGRLTGGMVEARWFAHTVFLNRGDHFEARRLPREAQASPAFGLSAADFDGDGREDLFLAQNFFATEPEAWRLDAGRGLVLRGDGRGGFEPMSGGESGVVVWGEQRGCAVADFDGDGRPDLAVAQNRGPTRLFRNQGGRPGLRVRLPWPAGLGATVRAVFGDSLGPARAVQAGAGYGSQDGAVLVLATPAPPTAVEIRWPGGRVSRSPVPDGAREVKIPAH
ncbi:MAG: CRTAC1 family protein, partial [Verrucomicrobiota bacterium]